MVKLFVYIATQYLSYLYLMVHILLIEDNQTIGNNIKLYLEHEWHTVDRFTEGLSWRDRALQYVYDAIVLDIMLPGLDGVSLLQEVRKKSQTPIIMTAHSSLFATGI